MYLYPYIHVANYRQEPYRSVFQTGLSRALWGLSHLSPSPNLPPFNSSTTPLCLWRMVRIACIPVKNRLVLLDSLHIHSILYIRPSGRAPLASLPAPAATAAKSPRTTLDWTNLCHHGPHSTWPGEIHHSHVSCHMSRQLCLFILDADHRVDHGLGGAQHGL